jgi:transposase-like protein
MTKPRKKREVGPEFDPAARRVARRAPHDELFRQMKKALMERALAGELTHHLGYAPGEAKPRDQPNHRSGTTRKTVLTEDGAIPLAIPRDPAGTFAPQLVPQNARRLPRFDQNVISLYARG